MRWMFLLLLVLNVFYYVWHQQEAPLRAKDVTPLNLYRGSQQDIRLLSESGAASRERTSGSTAGNECLFLGGFSRQELIEGLERRLAGMGISAQPASKDLHDADYWLRIAPSSERLLGDVQLQNLSKEFNELKHKIMLCEGVAPTE
jgi:hypothetical protein